MNVRYRVARHLAAYALRDPFNVERRLACEEAARMFQCWYEYLLEYTEQGRRARNRGWSV